MAAGLVGQRGYAAIGGQQAVVGLVEADDALGQVELRVAPHDLVAVERFERYAGGLVGRPNAVERQGVGCAEVEPADRHDQLLIDHIRKLAPERVCSLCEAHIIERLIGQSDDPRRAMRATVSMPNVELFEQERAVSILRKLIGRSASHYAAADNDHIRNLLLHRRLICPLAHQALFGSFQMPANSGRGPRGVVSAAGIQNLTVIGIMKAVLHPVKYLKSRAKHGFSSYQTFFRS